MVQRIGTGQGERAFHAQRAAPLLRGGGSAEQQRPSRGRCNAAVPSSSGRLVAQRLPPRSGRSACHTIPRTTFCCRL